MHLSLLQYIPNEGLGFVASRATQVLDGNTSQQTLSRLNLASLAPLMGTRPLELVAGGQADLQIVELRLALPALMEESPHFKQLIAQTIETSGGPSCVAMTLYNPGIIWKLAVATASATHMQHKGAVAIASVFVWGRLSRERSQHCLCACRWTLAPALIRRWHHSGKRTCCREQAEVDSLVRIVSGVWHEASA